MSADPLFHLKEDWEVTTLGDVAARGGGLIQTGPFGSQLHASDYVEQGIPSIMPQNITTDRISEEGIARITEEDAKRLSKYRVRAGDIVYSRRGDVERRALVRQENDGWLCGTGCLKVSLGTGVVVPEYAAFYLSHPASKAWVVQHAVGATMPNLNTSILSALPFVLPPMEEQKQIASALSALDDKIELNRRMNETLEEMARALFRDWFVDFGPTRRQVEGATDPAAIMGHAFPPEKAAAFAPLFPAKLGDDGFPEGWEEQPFESFVEIVGGGTPKTKIAEYWGGDIPWFSVVDAPTQGAVYVHSTEKSITNAGLDNSSARMVPEGTTIISARGTVGKIGMAPRDMTFNQSCYALRPKDPVGERFVFLATGQLVERLQAMAHGSVFSTITRNTFSSLSFAGADGPCYAAFEDITATLFAKIKANGQENQTLAEMRDLLLPKLMSGEIRLKDAGVGNEVETEKSNAVFATDMFGAKVLTPEQKAEREVVMVAANVDALQTDDLLVGNVRLMKANYLIHRRMGWPTSEFERRAAGPHCKRLNDDVREMARQRSWIRQTTSTNAQNKRIPGNRPASKFSEVSPLVAQYGLSDAIVWLQKHFKGASRDWMECVATVDDAMQMLTRQGADITVESVKTNIAATPEWEAKLSKSNFTDTEIRKAIKKLGEIF